MEKNRFYNIDFLKFIFCISIFLFHMPNSFGLYAPASKDFILQFRGGFVCVEFFFIIAGFFWCLNADKCKNILDFAVKKTIRMWPVLCFAIIICTILGWIKFLPLDIYANIETLLFLNGFDFNIASSIHGGRGILHPTWFISILFWILILFQYMYNNFNKKNLNLIMAMFVFVLLTYQIRVHGGSTVGVAVKGVYPLIPFWVTRGFYSCAIGYFIAELYKNFYPIMENITLSTKWNWILSTINCFALGTIGHNLFIYPTLNKHVAFLIICFVFVLILFAFNKDSVSRFFNQQKLGALGAYSFAIYVMHAIPLELFKKHIFIKKHTTFLSDNTETMIFFYIVSVLVLGIATYLFVEKPMTNKLLAKWKLFKDGVGV